MKIKSLVVVGAVLAALAALMILNGCDRYADLLKKQGFTVMTHPRSEFGTGTLFRALSSNRELFVAAPEECFPGLDRVIHLDAIKLIDSQQQSGLTIRLGAKYLPAEPTTIAGAFGVKNITRLDVSFGQTTANDLTVEGFAHYMEGKKVSKRCLDYLKDPKTNLIVSAARIKDMKYTM